MTELFLGSMIFVLSIIVFSYTVEHFNNEYTKRHKQSLYDACKKVYDEKVRGEDGDRFKKIDFRVFKLGFEAGVEYMKFKERYARTMQDMQATETE